MCSSIRCSFSPRPLRCFLSGILTTPPNSESDQGASPATPDGPDYEHQDAGADEGDHDGAQEADRPMKEEPDQESSDQRTQQADHEVADQAVSAALHHQSGQPAGNQAGDYPGDQASSVQLHLRLLFQVVVNCENGSRYGR